METSLKLVEFTILEDKSFNNMALQTLSVRKITKARKEIRAHKGEDTVYDESFGKPGNPH